jgi:3-oxosteroid 1-dehydrogenase
MSADSDNDNKSKNNDLNNQALSRRDLLQISTVAAAGLAASTVSAQDQAVGPQWHWETDVVVCGSGAAGFTAALFAAKGGARVLLVEKSGSWGGTTAKSGCHIWIPNNADLRARGVADERLACLQYMAQYSYPSRFQPDDAQLGLDDNTFSLLEAYYDNASPMVEQMTQWGACSFRGATLGADPEDFTPDYFDHSPWNKVPSGRGMQPVVEGVPYATGRHVVQQVRKVLQDSGVEIRQRHRATRLLRNSAGSVVGLVVQNDAGDAINIRCRRGVVFATGCYSHNRDYLQRYQMLPVFGSCSVATNEGDFIRIAGQIGAQMGNMSGAWRAQVVLEETLKYRAVPTAVFWPPGDSMLLVNKAGQRFVNEKRSYNDRVRQTYSFDATEVEYPYLINFMIYDQRTADLNAGTYPIPPIPAAADHVIVGQTLDDLAENLAVRLYSVRDSTGGIVLEKDFAAQLKASVRRFNQLAAAGVDEDFQRGLHAEDRGWYRLYPKRPSQRWANEPDNGSTMYPLQDTGPYTAIILAPGILGTKGGPRIHARAQVLDYQDRPIPGLFAAGNCMANPAGNAYWAAGATIGSAMTFGKIAGEQVLLQPEAPL